MKNATPAVRDAHAFADVDRLTSWLDDNLPELGAGPLTIDFLHGGTSNVILTLSRGEAEMVLRRAPPEPPPGSVNTIQREATILSALKDTDVPHPAVHARCDDASVIGSPFYIMDRVDGWAGRLTDSDTLNAAPFDRQPFKYGVAFALTDALVCLANVDYRAIGLEGFGKPEGFHERQVDRWSKQLASYPALYGYAGRDLPGIDYVAQWLRDHRPADYMVGILHGDVGLPNTLFGHGAPARVAALIDWELSTIGDPLLDLGGFVNAMRDEREPDRMPDHWSFKGDGYPTRQELARYYAAGTGRDVSNLDYYMVLALYKNACIVEYKVAQAQIGKQSAKTGRFFGDLVLKRIAEAERIARLPRRSP